MSAESLVMLGAVAAAAGVAGYIFWPERWRNHKPMPPLQRRIPGLPDDKPNRPVSPCEKILSAVLIASWADPDVVAADPMEQR